MPYKRTTYKTRTTRTGYKRKGAKRTDYSLFRDKSRRYAKKKPYGSWARYRNIIPNINTLLPPRLPIRGRWQFHNEYDGITLSQTSPLLIPFRANSIYDPNFNEILGGNNDRSIHGYSVFSQHYGKYRVNFAVFVVSLYNHCDNDLVLGLQARSKPDGSDGTLDDTITDYKAASISQFVKTKYVSRVSVGNGKSNVTMKFVLPIATMLQLSKVEFKTDSKTKSAIDTDPAKTCFFNICVWKLGQTMALQNTTSADNKTITQEWHGVDTAKCNFGIHVRAKMYALLTNRKQLPITS